MQAKKIIQQPGLRTIMLSFSLCMVGIIAAVTVFLFAGFYSVIIDMENRIQKYIILDQLSSELKLGKNEFIHLFDEIRSRETDEVKTYEQNLKDLHDFKELSINAAYYRYKALLTVRSLTGEYQEDHEQYYLNRGIENGIQYINEACSKIEENNFHLSQETYTSYYNILLVFNYIQDYASNQYLSAAVTSNVSASIENINKTTQLRKYSIILLLIILSASIIVSIFITRKLSNNIKEMLWQAEQITGGNLKTKNLKLYGPRELILLRSQINTMKKSLYAQNKIEKQLHKQELEHEKITKELEIARLHSLQAQINPHFLFNTLNIISHTVLFEHTQEAVKLISSLASLFRYSLEFKNEATIAEELSFVEKYLEIQKARFNNRISYSIECEENLSETVIPPLCIQPLVENAVIHGIEPTENGGSVNICVKKNSQNKIIISIEDNGIGLKPELEYKFDFSTENTPFNSSEIDDTSERTHVGIYNVVKRIGLFYNKKATIEIKRANETCGTIIEISIPETLEN